MKILNGQDAFEAMMAGRKILCRAVGELMDFDDLDRFPATIFAKMLINRIQEMDSIEALERLAPAIPAAKFNPEDHQELLQIYAERKTAMQHADYNSEAS